MVDHLSCFATARWKTSRLPGPKASVPGDDLKLMVAFISWFGLFSLVGRLKNKIYMATMNRTDSFQHRGCVISPSFCCRQSAAIQICSR